MVGEAASAAEATAGVREWAPDVVIVGVTMPRGSGLHAVAGLLERVADARAGDSEPLLGSRGGRSSGGSNRPRDGRIGEEVFLRRLRRPAASMEIRLRALAGFGGKRVCKSRNGSELGDGVAD